MSDTAREAVSELSRTAYLSCGSVSRPGVEPPWDILGIQLSHQQAEKHHATRQDKDVFYELYRSNTHVHGSTTRLLRQVETLSADLTHVDPRQQPRSLVTPSCS